MNDRTKSAESGAPEDQRAGDGSSPSMTLRGRAVPAPSRAPKRSHAWIDARSLAMARRIAEKLRRKPELVSKALENLERWKATLTPWPPALAEWEAILHRASVAEVVAILIAETDEGQRLRQSNPFAGVLTQAERKTILREYDSVPA